MAKNFSFTNGAKGSPGTRPCISRDTAGGAIAIRLGEGSSAGLIARWEMGARAAKPARPRGSRFLPTGPGEEQPMPSAGLTEFYSATWFPDGKRVLFVAAGSDGKPRSYIEDVNGGEARAITEETVQAVLVSPEAESSPGGHWPRGDFELRPIDGGQPRPIRGALPGDDPIQWSADGRFLYVIGMDNSTVEFFRLNLATGRRERWKKMELADPVGMIGIQPAAVRITPDGRSYVYSYWRTLTELYLVDHLK